LLAVEAGRAADMCAGDIVVCFQAGRFFTHRVLRRQGQHLVTRGDASLRIDPRQRRTMPRSRRVRRKEWQGPSPCTIDQYCRSFSGIPA
jgi:hypothetical protein